MSSRHASLLGLIVVVASGIDAAGNDEPADVKQKTVSLLRQLNADAVGERDKAEAALLALGPAVLTHLPPLDNKELSGEQRRRLTKIIPKLWQAKIVEEVGGSRVTLPAGPLSLADSLRELEKQSGNAIKDEREEFNQEVTNPTIAWDGKTRPFWEALDLVCKQAKVGVYHFAGDRGVSIRGNDASPTAFQTVGAFRFSVQGIGLDRDFTSGQPAKCVVRMQGLFEPRLRPIQVEIDVANVQVFDDKNRPLAAVAQRQSMYTFAIEEGAHHFDMAFNLAAPPRDAVKLAKIEGEVLVHLPANTERFEFTDWTGEKPSERTTANLRVAVGGAKDEGDGIWSFKVTVGAAGETPAVESYLAAALEQEVYLQKADGSRLAPNAGRNAKEEDGKTVVEYLFSNAPGKMPDYRVIVRIPAGVTKVPVRFSFKDLELP